MKLDSRRKALFAILFNFEFSIKEGRIVNKTGTEAIMFFELSNVD